MKKYLAGFLIVVLVFFVFCEFTLPELVAGTLERGVAKSSLKPRRVAANVIAFPAAKILLGQIDGARLKMEEVAFQDCRASSFTAEIPRGTFVWKNLKEGEFIDFFKPAGPIRVQVVFGERELNDYLSRVGVQGIMTPSLDLGSRGVKLEGKMRFLGNSLVIQLWGNFQVQDGQIEFLPSDLWVEGKALPPELVQEFISHLRFRLTKVRPPFSFQAQKIDVVGDNLIITGQI